MVAKLLTVHGEIPCFHRFAENAPALRVPEVSFPYKELRQSFHLQSVIWSCSVAAILIALGLLMVSDGKESQVALNQARTCAEVPPTTLAPKTTSL